MEAEPLSAALISPHWWHCVPPVQIPEQVLVSEGGHWFQPNCLFLSGFPQCLWHAVRQVLYFYQPDRLMYAPVHCGIRWLQWCQCPSCWSFRGTAPLSSLTLHSSLCSGWSLLCCTLHQMCPDLIRFYEVSLCYLTIFSFALITPHEIHAFISCYKHETWFLET